MPDATWRTQGVARARGGGSPILGAEGGAGAERAERSGGLHKRSAEAWGDLLPARGDSVPFHVFCQWLGAGAVAPASRRAVVDLLLPSGGTGESLASLLALIPAAVVRASRARGSVFFLLDGDGFYSYGEIETAEILLSDLRRMTQILAHVHTEGSSLRVPVRSGVRAKGILIVDNVTLSTETADALGRLVGLAIDRLDALEIVARSEAAKQGERLRSTMTDSFTRELRTPLTSIKGAATALLESELPREQSRELLAVIDEECDRMNRLVAEAVQMAQLDPENVHLRMTRCSLRRLVERAREECSWIEEQHVIHTDLPADLEVRVDPHLFTKALRNLLENAAKYSRPGTHITLSAAQNRHACVISVADQGPGIEPAEQPLVFERFLRGRSGQSVSGGTGMGLAISRAIVEAHHGRIELASKPATGSVFTIHLPRM